MKDEQAITAIEGGGESPSPLADPNRLAFSVDEVAVFLGIGRSLLYEQIRRGQFPHIRVGKRYLITRQGLTEYLGGASEHTVAS